jgi:multicomponent Na+:H+ antiporter subunit B
MKSLILAKAAQFLKPLLLVFSILVLLRGHNDPGGGFVGGLVAAAGFALQAIAAGTPAARRSLRAGPHQLVTAGLLAAGSSGLVGVFRGEPFLSAQWAGPLSTVLLFDIGVYLVVIGTVLLVVFELMEHNP